MKRLLEINLIKLSSTQMFMLSFILYGLVFTVGVSLVFLNKCFK
jgi:hypothetical protein